MCCFLAHHVPSWKEARLAALVLISDLVLNSKVGGHLVPRINKVGLKHVKRCLKFGTAHVGTV